MDSGAGDAQEPVSAVGTDAATMMREARERAGYSLADVAQRTRVPLRHLEALERGDYGALPGVTYCAGFARAYARAVDIDEARLVAKVREEVETSGDLLPERTLIEEPADPARIPPRFLAWAAAIIGILLVSGYGIWRMQVDAPPAEVRAGGASPEGAAAVRRVAPASASAAAGPAVLTAQEDVWLRIYDADGKTLYQGTLKQGTAYTVPAGAKGPMILTGRPDALAVTVGGRPIPPLGTAERTIADVPVSAAALLQRIQPAPSAGTSSSNTAPSAGAPSSTVPAGGAPSADTPRAALPATVRRPAAARPQARSEPQVRAVRDPQTGVAATAAPAAATETRTTATPAPAPGPRPTASDPAPASPPAPQ